MPSFHPRTITKLPDAAATWPRRFGALAIDIILLLGVAGVWIAVGRFTDISLIDAWIGPIIMVSIIIFLIATVTRRKHENGQSLGKQMAGLRIVREDNAPVRSSAVLLREVLCKWFPLGICSYGLASSIEQSYWWLYLTVPALMLVFTIFANGRAPHDVLARTRVMLEHVGRE